MTACRDHGKKTAIRCVIIVMPTTPRGALPATKPLQPAAQTPEDTRTVSHTHARSHVYDHTCKNAAPLSRNARSHYDAQPALKRRVIDRIS